MSQPLNIQLCRIVASEKLTDRFLVSGVLTGQETTSLSKQVTLVYLFEITRPWFPSSTVIPSLVHAIEEQYPQLTPNESLGDQFELLLRTVNQQLNTLSEHGETDWIGNFNGLIMAVGGEELHFSQSGSAPAYLLQNNRIRQITDESGEREPHPLKTFSNLASGSLKAGDQILIANHDLYREISLDALRRIVGRVTPYQASQVIAKELKRAKNPAVSSVIMRILSESEAPAAEPTELLLEEEMQSAARKAHKRLLPVLTTLGRYGNKAGKAGLQAARQTGSVLKNTVAPVAVDLLKKGAEGAKTIGEKVADKLATIPEETAPVEPAAPVVVERILPRVALKESIESLIPLSELELDSAQGSAAPMAKPLAAAHISVRQWLSNTRNKKLTALVGGALLITLVIGLALSRQKPSASPQVQNQNAQHLSQATTLVQKSVLAIQQQQNAAAIQDIQQAQTELAALQSPSAEQAAQANSLNDTLTTQSDGLSGTLRLAASATYSFTAPAGGLVSGLPYFYGYGAGGLLRTGKGETSQVQKTISVPGSSDSIISLAASSETGAVAYALTSQDKLYRLSSNASGDASLSPLQPAAGDSFAKGDVVATYNGNLYVLDSVTGLFWKYASTGSGYAKGVSVVDKTKYDIGGSVSVAIDGSVYLLKRDGTLLKFTSGQQNTDFSLKNIPDISKTLVQPRQVITSDSMQSIYVLDAGLSTGTRSTARVLEFGKDGTFIRQYAFPKDFTKVQGFDIDQQNKKMWILNGATVSEFDIQ